MARNTHSQLLVGDNLSARELGYSDAMRGLDLDPGQVPKGKPRAAYGMGYARGEARQAAAVTE